MALSCPNKSLPEWKRLVDEVGEREALNDYFQFGTIRSPYAVKDKLERLNIANYTNKNFKIGERYFKPTVESLIDVEKNSSVVDAMVTHFGYRGLQSEEDLIKRKFTDDIRPVETVLTQPTTTTTKSQTETVVQELFESDSELANRVYSALGFNFRYTSEKWKDDPTKENKATYINIKGTPSNQEFQVKKDIEEGFYSVHFKTEQGKLTKEQIQTLVDAVASQIPIGGKLSTWGEITKGGISGLNRFLNNGFKKVGEREIKDREGRPIVVPILEKVEKSNLEAQAVNWNYKKAGKNLAIGDVVEVVYSKSTKPEYPYFLNFMVDGVPNINNEEKSLKLALKGLTPEEKISFCNHFGITMTEENGTKC